MKDFYRCDFCSYSKSKTALLLLFFLLTLIHPAKSQNIPSYLPTDGLVGWWPFNGNAKDESGNGYNGVPFNTTLVSDRFGNSETAYNFNGSDSFVELTDLSFLNNQTKISFSFWAELKPNLIGGAAIGFWGSCGGCVNSNLGAIIGVQSLDGIIAYSNNSGTSGSSGALPPSSGWHHFVFVLEGEKQIDSEKLKLYIDSKATTLNYTFLNSYFGQAQTFFIGKFQSGPGSYMGYYDGPLDDIAIFNRALTESEILSLYQGGSVELSSTTFSENTPSGTAVSTISYSGNKTGTFTLASGEGDTDNSSFSVSGDQLITATTFDASVKSEYAVRISFTDSLGVTNSRSFKLNVLPAYLPSDGLVGWWPFNGNANDESGNGNDGVVNEATLTTDRFGVNSAAYSLDGINDNIDVGNSSTMDIIIYDTLTISVWVKPSTINSQGALISRYYQFDSNKSSFGIIYGDGKIGIYGNGTDAYILDINTPNAWQNIVIRFARNSGNASLYINGIFIGTGNITYNSNSTNTVVSIGRMFDGVPGSVYSQHFPGLLDDIAIYNRALTPDEILSLYKSGHPKAQTITFTLPQVMYQDQSPYTLVATSTSNGPIEFTMVEGNASISGNILTINGPGLLKIKASQAGTDIYLPADTTATTTVAESYIVSGLITKPVGIPVSSGLAKLFYENGGMAKFGEVVNGNYSITLVRPSRYILQVVPTGSGDNEVFPAYYNAAILHKDATVIEVSGDTTVSMELPAKPSSTPKGQGQIKGKVTSGNGGGRFIVGRISEQAGLPDVPVYLLDLSDQVLKTVTTDKDGFFSFNELASGSFKIALDVVGASLSESSTIVNVDPLAGVLEVSASITTVDGQPVVSLGVEVITGLSTGEAILRTYPNPAEDEVRLVWRSNSNAPVQVALTNSSGQVLWSVSRKVYADRENELGVSVKDLPQGMYLLRLEQGVDRRVLKVLKQ